ncbi:hypothetical protein TNCV_1778651 [Trichonephila clavipes]|nr:hypothetical protein TNCV_1778651 [Trichonephila clavipes]
MLLSAVLSVPGGKLRVEDSVFLILAYVGRQTLSRFSLALRGIPTDLNDVFRTGISGIPGIASVQSMDFFSYDCANLETNTELKLLKLRSATLPFRYQLPFDLLAIVVSQTPDKYPQQHYDVFTLK